MELYVPNTQLKQVAEVLDQEGVTYKVTGKTFSLVVEGKEVGEVTEVKAELVETDVPVVLESPSQTRRAFRLPSGKKILLTDLDGNFESLVEPPPGWER
jgi:hypothetical protein